MKKETKCENGYIHPYKEGLTEGMKCNECNEKECMFRSSND
jgi:hypothetical protein